MTSLVTIVLLTFHFDGTILGLYFPFHEFHGVVFRLDLCVRHGGRRRLRGGGTVTTTLLLLPPCRVIRVVLHPHVNIIGVLGFGGPPGDILKLGWPRGLFTKADKIVRVRRKGFFFGLVIPKVRPRFRLLRRRSTRISTRIGISSSLVIEKLISFPFLVLFFIIQKLFFQFPPFGIPRPRFHLRFFNEEIGFQFRPFVIRPFTFAVPPSVCGVLLLLLLPFVLLFQPQ